MKIAICEDERVYLDLIRERTLSFFKRQNMEVTVHSFDDAIGLLNKIDEGRDYDLILMDIQMKHSDGMEAAAALRERKVDSCIIFVTAIEEMAVQGYGVDALDFVVKKRLDERLPEALKHFLEKYRKNTIVIPVKGYLQSDKTAVIKLSELLWVESDGRDSKFVTRNEEIESSLNIGKAKEMLPEADFTESYKSVFVNISEIKRVGGDTVLMSNDRTLPISRRKRNDVLCAVLNKVKGIQ